MLDVVRGHASRARFNGPRCARAVSLPVETASGGGSAELSFLVASKRRRGCRTLGHCRAIASRRSRATVKASTAFASTSVANLFRVAGDIAGPVNVEIVDYH